MYIKKALFDACFYSGYGVCTVYLRGDREIPHELVQIAKEVDGENYEPSCFGIDVFKDGATIHYMSEHGVVDLNCTCDNYEEVFEYYKKNADKKDLEELFKYWSIIKG